jgi:intergrase/recombinase
VGNIIKFACLVGLRASEVVESVRLLNVPQNSGAHYYNPERQALEHFRFPEIFLRQTKKAYISFVTPAMLKLVDSIQDAISYMDIRYSCRAAGIKCDLRYARKIFASHLRASGIQPEIIDMLQGRVSSSVLTRHYLVPSADYKAQVLQALEKLKNQL